MSTCSEKYKCAGIGAICYFFFLIFHRQNFQILWQAFQHEKAIYPLIVKIIYVVGTHFFSQDQRNNLVHVS